MVDEKQEGGYFATPPPGKIGVKVKDFFGTHGHKTSKFSPTGISNYPLSQHS